MCVLFFIGLTFGVFCSPVNPGRFSLFDLFGASHLCLCFGLGFSDIAADFCWVETPHADNLGITLVVEDGGDIPLTTGVAALSDEPRIGLIKIDFEGMELRALTGLECTQARTRPNSLFEVDHE